MIETQLSNRTDLYSCIALCRDCSCLFDRLMASLSEIFFKKNDNVKRA